MFAFPCPVKVDWLNLAFIADGDTSVRVLADTLISDVEACFDADRQDAKQGFNSYKVRYPIGFFKNKNFSHVANVSFGGNTKSKLGEHVQLSISGSDADFYYRNSIYESSLAYIQRIDLAYDVVCDYSDLITALKGIDDLRRLKWSKVTSVEAGLECTTTYIGSRESAFFVRVYEKGKQVGGDPNWVRIEFEVKPTKTSTDFAIWCYEQYLKNPEEILTRCKFTHAILSALFSNPVSAYTPRDEKRLPSTVSSFSHMIEQYSGVISGLSELYNLENVLSLAREVHRLKQSDDEEIRNSSKDAILQFLESAKKPSTPV